MYVIETDPDDNSVYYCKGYKLVTMVDFTINIYKDGELLETDLAGLPGALRYIDRMNPSK